MEAAEKAARQAYALLGVVTHRANNVEIQAYRKDGSAYVKVIRDTTSVSVDHRAKAKKSDGKLKPENGDELEPLTETQQHTWEVTAGGKVKKTAKAFLKNSSRAKAERTRERKAKELANSARAAQEIAASLTKAEGQPSAKSRLDALKERIRRKTAAASASD